MDATRPEVVVADLRAALRHVPADDRDTWVRMGMACHSLGDDMFEVWDEWSRTSEAYEERSALSAWKSFKPGAIGVGTLFHTARLHGWAPGEKFDEEAYRKRRVRYAQQRRATQAQVRREQAMISERAKAVLKNATLAHHPYLSRKGFAQYLCGRCALSFDWEGTPAECPLCEAPVTALSQPYQMLVANGRALVPMRDVRTQEVVSLQAIDAEGNKRFLKGGRKKDTMFQLGRGREIWMCEGYATALSLRAALNHMQRKDFSVVVTFDAYNFVSVAQSMVAGRRGVAVADNDPWRCEACKHRWYQEELKSRCPQCRGTIVHMPVGPEQAHKTMLPVFLPSEPGDVNDLHASKGLEAVCDELRVFLGIGVASDAHGACKNCGGTTIRRTRGNGHDNRCIACGRETYQPL